MNIVDVISKIGFILGCLAAASIGVAIAEIATVFFGMPRWISVANVGSMLWMGATYLLIFYVMRYMVRKEQDKADNEVEK